MAAATFHTVIVSPDQIVFEGELERLTVPGVLQDLAILPHHTPLYAQLKTGTIIAQLAGGTTQKFPVESGIIRVKRDQVSVLVGFETRESVFKA